MSWTQKQFTLPAKSRGSYLITNDVLNAVPEIKNYKVGLLHLFIQHTSCALSLNENWDEDVREDMSASIPSTTSTLSLPSLLTRTSNRRRPRPHSPRRSQRQPLQTLLRRTRRYARTYQIRFGGS
jgi:hypothetical protein